MSFMRKVTQFSKTTCRCHVWYQRAHLNRNMNFYFQRSLCIMHRIHVTKAWSYFAVSGPNDGKKCLRFVSDRTNSSGGFKIGRVLKTHTCGELTASHAGSVVTLRGFLNFSRVGRFVILRDSHGITQVMFGEEHKNLWESAADTPFESYVEVSGTVKIRPEGQENWKMPTGEIEVLASSFKVLNRARSDLPFVIRNFNQPKESLGMKFRYLDLRHEHLQANLRIRSQVGKKMRDYLQDVEGFIEITTPTLSVKTPGGAQEFVVPTHDKGDYYCLVQSPQIYKQLAVIGGVEKYFQFALCFRDETSRPDRQPEFMQVDLEMSDVTKEEIQLLVENLIKSSWPSHLPKPQFPFLQLSYKEAMNSYGTEAPDTRFGWLLQDVTGCLKECGSETIMKSLAQADNSARAFVIPGGRQHINRAVVQSWEQIAVQDFRLKGPSVLHVEANKELVGKISKHMTVQSKEELRCFLGAEPGDTVVLVTGGCTALQYIGKLRVFAASILEDSGIDVRDPSVFKFVWIVDFPLFEEDKETGKLISLHHPFTRPHEDDVDLLSTDPLKVRSQHYDLVLNGCEIAGGSMRIHESSLQHCILKDVLQIQHSSLSFLTDALAAGAPPHGGIAIGFDRYISILCNAKSIREVIAFPKNALGRCPMSGAPSPITEKDKLLYHLPSSS